MDTKFPAPPLSFPAAQDIGGGGGCFCLLVRRLGHLLYKKSALHPNFFKTANVLSQTASNWMHIRRCLKEN